VENSTAIITFVCNKFRFALVKVGFMPFPLRWGLAKGAEFPDTSGRGPARD
jgi:hypothetical protein